MHLDIYDKGASWLKKTVLKWKELLLKLSPNTMFRVELDNKHLVIADISLAECAKITFEF